MNESLLFGVLESEGSVADNPQRVGQREEPLVVENVLHTAVGDVLHGEEVHFFVHADVVDLHNVRVAQPSGGSCFANEEVDEVRVLDQVWRQDLEGDIAVEGELYRSVDRTHSTATDTIENLVSPNDLPQQRVRFVRQERNDDVPHLNAIIGGEGLELGDLLAVEEGAVAAAEIAQVMHLVADFDLELASRHHFVTKGDLSGRVATGEEGTILRDEV